MSRAFAQLMLAVGASLSLMGCASSPTDKGRSFGSEPDVWERSQAHHAAFDAFVVRKQMPIGSKNNAVFYYKSCSEVGPTTWYSKTSYECTEP